MKKVVISSAMIIASILLGLLTAYVVLDISILFNITQITSLGFAKIYALISIIALVLYKKDKHKKEEKTYEEKMAETFVLMLEKTLLNLFVWGLMYIMHIIL